MKANDQIRELAEQFIKWINTYHEDNKLKDFFISRAEDPCVGDGDFMIVHFDDYFGPVDFVVSFYEEDNELYIGVICIKGNVVIWKCKRIYDGVWDVVYNPYELDNDFILNSVKQIESAKDGK